MKHKPIIVALTWGFDLSIAMPESSSPATFGQDQRTSSLRSGITVSHRNEVARCRSFWFPTFVLYYFALTKYSYISVQTLNFVSLDKPLMQQDWNM